jgi:uncharacterized C2H2 Zn-finger protein
MDSVLDRREGALPMIFCPMTNFKRPVVSCMCSCKKKDINWCDKIKQVAIDELDDVSKDLPEANLATWKERRDFFLAPKLGSRKQHDDYDESVHGGAGLKSAEELDEQQTLDKAGKAIDPSAEPEDESQVAPDDDEVERGPYDPDPDGDAGDTDPGDDEGLADAAAEAHDDDSRDLDDDDTGDGTENNDEPQEGDGMARKKCPHCGDMFKNARGLGIHLGRAHADKAKAPASSKKKASKKAPSSAAPSTPSASSTPAKKKTPRKKAGTRGKSTGPWIVLGANEKGCLVEDPEKLAETVSDMREEVQEDQDEEVRIFEIAKEVKIQTEVTIVDV